MKRQLRFWFALVLTGAAAVLGSTALSVAHAQGGERYVAPGGTDANNDCALSSNPCATVQRAVDVAASGDLIKVATGNYTGVQARPAPADYPNPPPGGLIDQAVYLSKTLTARGGYTTADWNTSDPDLYPTTLDAQGQGRVVFVAGGVSPILEGVRLVNGDAGGLGGTGSSFNLDGGGGLYVANATLSISRCTVSGSAAQVGGGLYASSSDITLIDNTITANDAEHSGALSAAWGTATLKGNRIMSNTSFVAGVSVYGWQATLEDNLIEANSGGYGVILAYTTATLNRNTIATNSSGIYVETDNVVTLTANTIVSNTPGGGIVVPLSTNTVTLISNTIRANTSNDMGGGVYVAQGSAMLIGNTIVSNTSGADGGGVYGDVTLINNTIAFNMSSSHGGGVCGYGTLTGNIISNNTAGGYGGGVLGGTLTDNIISNNIAGGDGGGVWGGSLTGNTIYDNQAQQNGGGVYLTPYPVTLTNNIIAGNQANALGSGIYVHGASHDLRHNTIAHNIGGDGSGVYVNAGSVNLVNTILVSHTLGIRVAAGGSAQLDATLWGAGEWANLTDWAGPGSITTGTLNLWGDPAFVNPQAGDYHIGYSSAALDAGVEAGVTSDIDGQVRPLGSGYDIGADESTLQVVAYALNVTAGAWHTFTDTCAQIWFTDTNGVNAVTVTLTYDYPSLNRGGLPRRYDIEANGSGFQAMLALCYQDADLIAAGIPFALENDLHIYQYMGGGLWTKHSQVDPAHNVITATHITDFGIGVWGIGAQGGSHPTAVTLRGLRGLPSATRLPIALVLMEAGLLGIGCLRRRRKTQV